MIRNILFVLLLSGFLAGCLPAPFYQKEVAIPQNAWNYSFKPTFKFDITDTATGYDTYFIIRHTQAYPYANLWIWLYIKSPGDSIARKERINIVLAEPNGKWMGRGMGEIYEQRLQINLGDSVHFDRKGLYEVAMEQNMRINPLPEVLHVGLCVKKKELR